MTPAPHQHCYIIITTSIYIQQYTQCVCLSWLLLPPVTLCETRYLPLCDDVEGAALLSLPDDILSFVVVLLTRQGRGEDEEGEENSQK